MQCVVTVADLGKQIGIIHTSPEYYVINSGSWPNPMSTPHPNKADQIGITIGALGGKKTKETDNGINNKCLWFYSESHYVNCKMASNVFAQKHSDLWVSNFFFSLHVSLQLVKCHPYMFKTKSPLFINVGQCMLSKRLSLILLLLPYCSPSSIFKQKQYYF